MVFGVFATSVAYPAHPYNWGATAALGRVQEVKAEEIFCLTICCNPDITYGFFGWPD
jgi:hypothetical protein